MVVLVPGDVLLNILGISTFSALVKALPCPSGPFF